MAFIQDFVTFVTSFDIFGEYFTFKIKKRKYYTSFFGGFTSLAFVIYSLYYLFSATCRGYCKRSIYTISAFAFSIISPNSLATHALLCIGRAMEKLSKAERGRTNKTLRPSLLEDSDTPCKHEIQTHPLWYISIMMSLPPMNSPHTYS